VGVESVYEDGEEEELFMRGRSVMCDGFMNMNLDEMAMPEMVLIIRRSINFFEST
jgi:hypothetical protein